MEWFEKLKKSLGALTAEMEKGDGADKSKIREALNGSDEALKAAKFPGGDGASELDAFKKSVKADIDALTTQVREAQKAGLAVRGSQILVPGGREARIEMLADRRAFLSDATAERFGAYLCGVVNGRGMPDAARKLFEGVCKDNDLDPASASGQAAIPNEFRQELIRNVEATARVYPRMRRVPLSTLGTTSFPKRTGGLTAYPTAALAEIQKSLASLTTVTMTPVKWAALAGAGNEFFVTGNFLVDVGQWFGVEIVEAIANAMDDAVVNGDGTATYGGITGLMQSATISDVTAAAHTTGATLDASDVSAVSGGLTVDYGLDDPAWYLSLSMKGHLRALKATTGVPIYQQGGNGEPNNIDGYPFVISNKMPTKAAATAATRWGAFGTLSRSHYVGVLRDLRIEKSDQPLFGSDITLVKGVIYFDAKEVDPLAVVCGKTHA